MRYKKIIPLAVAAALALSLSACDRYSEGFEDGRGEGYAAGYAAGAALNGSEDGGGFDAGYSQGYSEGYSDGVKSASEYPPNGVTDPSNGGENYPDPVSPEQDSSGFVSLSDQVPGVLLELRYYSSYNFVGERIDGYEEPVALITREAADALKSAEEELETLGYRLKIYDAYRPQTAVNCFIRWSENGDTQMKPYFYPNEDKTALFDKGYISKTSGHTRGSTVDVTLFDMALGRDADMGGTFDFFGERSHRDYTDGLTEAQIANRSLLRRVMEENGFKSISTEWWHFTLKDEPYPRTYFDFPVKSLD